MGSKRVQVVLTLFCIALHSSSALFFPIFGGPRKQQAAIPIDADCESKALAGDCLFYQCFNERHPCNASKSNYAIDYGWTFCSRFDAHRDRLTEEGLRWLNGTWNCSMGRMLEHYRESAILCSEIETDMRDKHAACEASNGLCRGRLLADNANVLSDVYTLSLNSGSQFLFSLEKCAMDQLGDAMSWLRGRFGVLQSAGQRVLQSVLPIIGDVQDQTKKMTSNFGGEVNGAGNNRRQGGIWSWFGFRRRRSVN